MSFGLQDCCQVCPTPETVSIPGLEGPPGTDGTNGTNGVSAFTFTTADFVVPPADGATPVTVEVENTSWMAAGEPIFIPGGLFFLVDAIIDSTHFSVVSPDWESNTHAGDTISAGEKVSPSGWQPAVTPLPAINAVVKYASGTGHVITGAAFAEVTFGTSGAEEITLTTAGAWMLYARARVDYTGSTFAASRTVSLKLHRQNNTPGDVANAATAFKTRVVTAETSTAIDLVVPPVMYSTAGVTDIIEMMVAIDTDPSGGTTITIVECEIVAVFLHA